ncbi:MAG: hypothetical protein RML72_01765 [Bacteroidia bacterium]|nr:hypothetical protein [Bacteroidia bacterium]MDW8157587.1 hypothetical protein [Bacteroidia bacterium]
MLDFSFSYLTLPSQEEEIKYLLQAFQVNINILTQEELNSRIHNFSQNQPTALLTPSGYEKLPAFFSYFVRISVPSLPQGEKGKWISSLAPYSQAIILPVIPWSSKAIDLEETVFWIKNTYPNLKVLVESTYLLGIEAFYMQAWQIDITFCRLSSHSYLWAEMEFCSSLENSLSNFAFDYLPELWNTYRLRALAFRNFLVQNSYHLKPFPLQSFGFTVFSHCQGIHQNYFLARELKDSYKLILPITQQGYLQVSHLPNHYTESIHLLEKALSENSTT